MDLEPGRCRRTDGKKWRCRLAVLPDQKYCERHIHRGCLRSRKPVEDPKTFIMSKPTATITVSPLKAAINLHSAAKSDARNHKSVHSFKIKKRSREDGCGALGFFPNNVLQNGNGTSSNNHAHHLAVPISERCRRTDGKKWQCTKGALHGQKYCAQHMHRGAKKVQTPQNHCTTLSFPIEASYQKKGNSVNQSNISNDDDDDDDGDETNSSSSDATTISM